MRNDNNAAAAPAALPTRPLRFLAAAELLAAASKTDEGFAALMGAHEGHITAFLRRVFLDRLVYWSETQRVLSHSHFVHTFMPYTAKLKSRFDVFASVDDLVDQCYAAVSARPAVPGGAFWSFVDGDIDNTNNNMAPVLQWLSCDDASGRVTDGTVSGYDQLSPAAQRAYRACFTVVLSLWSWSGSASCAHGLSPIDWEVVAAFESPALVATLNAKQQLIYQKAREYRETHRAYFGYMPPPPTVKLLEGELVRAAFAGRAAT